MPRISWRDHRIDLSVLEELNTPAQLLKDIQRRTVQYIRHVARADNLSTFLFQGCIAGTRKQGRPRRRSTDDVEDWIGSTVTETVRAAQDRTEWRSWVSLALTFNPPEWRWTRPDQTIHLEHIHYRMLLLFGILALHLINQTVCTASVKNFTRIFVVKLTHLLSRTDVNTCVRNCLRQCSDWVAVCITSPLNVYPQDYNPSQYPVPFKQMAQYEKLFTGPTAGSSYIDLDLSRHSHVQRRPFQVAAADTNCSVPVTYCWRPTLSNPVLWQNWIAAYLGYTLRM